MHVEEEMVHVNDEAGALHRSLELGGRDRRVGLGQLLLGLRFVIEGALVAVTVAVLRAKVIFTLALEAEQPNLPVARPAPAGVGLHLLGGLVFLRRAVGWLGRPHGAGGGRLGGDCRDR